jgi:hypothetical protein
MSKVSRYSSYRTMTAYEGITSWQAKRKVMRQEFESRQQAANDAFTNTWSGQIDGMNTIIAQIALDRITTEGKAKAAKQAEDAKNVTEIDTNLADTQDSIFSGESSSGQLDSGTKIDLNAGTITLSDGTVIDSKTGAKKINITV